MNRVFAFLLTLAVIIFCLSQCGVVYASGDDIRQNTHVDTGDVITGDSVLNSGSSRSLSIGMGDVDIAQCLASKSTPVFQWLKANPWCMADSLDAKGLHDMAAMVRCDLKLIRKHFVTQSDCLAANTMAAPLPAPIVTSSEPAGMVVKIDDDDDDERLLALQQRIDNIEVAAQRDAEAARRAAISARQSAQKAEQAERERKEQAQIALDQLAEYRK